MNTDNKAAETRTEFRILAGLLSFLFLLIGLPLSVMQAIGGGIFDWIKVLNVVFFGLAFFCVARTGHWLKFRKP